MANPQPSPPRNYLQTIIMSPSLKALFCVAASVVCHDIIATRTLRSCLENEEKHRATSRDFVPVVLNPSHREAVNFLRLQGSIGEQFAPDTIRASAYNTMDGSLSIAGLQLVASYMLLCFATYVIIWLCLNILPQRRKECHLILWPGLVFNVAISSLVVIAGCAVSLLEPSLFEDKIFRHVCQFLLYFSGMLFHASFSLQGLFRYLAVLQTGSWLTETRYFNLIFWPINVIYVLPHVFPNTLSFMSFGTFDGLFDLMVHLVLAMVYVGSLFRLSSLLDYPTEKRLSGIIDVRRLRTGMQRIKKCMQAYLMFAGFMLVLCIMNGSILGYLVSMSLILWCVLLIIDPICFFQRDDTAVEKCRRPAKTTGKKVTKSSVSAAVQAQHEPTIKQLEQIV